MSAARRLSEVLEHIARLELAPGQSADKRSALEALRGEAARLSAIVQRKPVVADVCERWSLMHYMSDMPEDGTFYMFREAVKAQQPLIGMPKGWVPWEPFEYWEPLELLECMEGTASSLRFLITELIEESKKEEA